MPIPRFRKALTYKPQNNRDEEKGAAMSSRLGERGISFVLDYERKMGRNPLDVSKKRYEFVGFDVISVSPDGNHRTIEVKTSESEGGIPDAYENEFTRSLHFVATHMYVVCFPKNGDKSSLHIIPKKEIDKYSGNQYEGRHSISRHIRFASQLKTRLKKGDFKKELG